MWKKKKEEEGENRKGGYSCEVGKGCRHTDQPRENLVKTKGFLRG